MELTINLQDINESLAEQLLPFEAANKTPSSFVATDQAAYVKNNSHDYPCPWCYQTGSTAHPLRYKNLSRSHRQSLTS